MRTFTSWAGAPLAVAILTLFLITDALTGSSAQAADKVGVAAAVKPEATSQPPGGETTTLKIGKSVVYNERIDTSGSGVVQVLLLDGSTFTVGPGSSLVIDKFVYNPGSGKGTLVASFSKGALRYVGGKLSKQEQGIAVKTPAGALTVRGAIFTGTVSGPNKAMFTLVFGKSLALNRGGQYYRLLTAGVFSITGPGAPVMRSQTMADVNLTQAAVSGKAWKKTASTARVKGKRWPYYYGIQTGTYPDQPFVKEFNYSGAAGDLILGGATRVPSPPPPPPPD